jgi:hypothetical protein
MKIIGVNITGSFILNGVDVTTTIQSSSIWSGSVASSIVSINSTTASLNTATSSLNAYTASASNRLSSIELTTGSLNTASGSAITRLTALEVKTGSLATTGSNTFVGNQTVSGSLIPAVNIAYDLGSSSNRWKDLYLSGSTIYLGETILSAVTGGIAVKDISGNYQNIIGSALQISGAATMLMDTASGMIKIMGMGVSSSSHMPVEFSGSFSGSFFGTSSLASQAVSSSYAINASTASYLSNYIPPFPYTGSAEISGSLTVTGNITAQTLVVQTITSSVDFVTGSSRFGSLSSNNHQFTGSVNITGSLSATSLTGSIAYSNLTGVPTLVSGSSQIVYSSISSIPAGIVSGSSQIAFGSITGLPSGLVSGSSQVTGIGNAQLTNSTISGISLGSNLATLTIGTGLSGTSYNGSTAVTIANSGVTSIVAGTGISINQGTGAVTVTNTITNNNQLTNGAGYITGINSSAVTTALGYTPYNSTNPSGYITGINSSAVTTALGYTPYNSTNPSGYLASVGIGNMTDAHRFWNNMGNNHGTYQDFNSVGNFGVRYMQGSTNGPQSGQFYGFTLGLGNDYAIGTYGSQFYWLRNTTNPYLWIRYQENGSWGSWTKGAAGYADNSGTTSQREFSYLRVNSNEDLYLDYNYGCSVVGVYSASRFQGVFAMGNAYKLARDGTSAGSLYGLAWSHPNAGGQAGYLDNHGLLVMLNGTTYSAISNSIWARGDVTAYSDARVKTNIEVVENAIEKIKAIRGVTFNRTDMEHDTKRHAGVIAQEVLAVLPEVVTTTKDGMHSVAYGNLAALFIEAIKEQQKEIDELKNLINGFTK